MIEEETEIIWFVSDKIKLNETYQQTGYKFSFIGTPEKNIAKQCHTWVKCRDFLPDAVRASIINKTFSIFGFTFNPETNPKLDLETMRMLVYKPGADNETFENKTIFGLKLLNHYEKIMKIEPSVLCRTKTDYKENPVYLFTGSAKWMSSPFLISLYTLLIRLGDKEIQFENNQELMDKYKGLIDKHKAGKIYDNDIGYLSCMWDVLHFILEEIATLTKIDPIFNNLGIDNTTFHNYTGITSLLKAQTPIPKINDMIKKCLK